MTHKDEIGPKDIEALFNEVIHYRDHGEYRSSSDGEKTAVRETLQFLKERGLLAAPDHVVVPREPTEEMKIAGMKSWDSFMRQKPYQAPSWFDMMSLVYKAMIAEWEKKNA